MNLIKILCKELGVEIGEVWTGSDGIKHRINSDGSIEWFCEHEKTWERLRCYEDLLSGYLKPKWTPGYGENYFVPNISMVYGARYEKYIWQNEDFDNWYLNNNLVFKTNVEAIEATNKMLRLLKGNE